MPPTIWIYVTWIHDLMKSRLNAELNNNNDNDNDNDNNNDNDNDNDNDNNYL